MRFASLSFGVLSVLLSATALAGDPGPARAPSPEEVDRRIDAALAAEGGARDALVSDLARDGASVVPRLLARLGGEPPSPVAENRRLLRLDVRFFEPTHGWLRRWLPDAGPERLAVRDLDPREADRLLDEVEQGPDVMQIRSAVLSQYDGQRSTFQVFEQTSYLAEPEPDLATATAGAAIRSVPEGISLTLRPRIRAGSRISLEVDASSSTLARPLATEDVEGAEGAEGSEGAGGRVTLQRPEVHTRGVARTLSLRDGRPALFALPGPFGAAEHPIRVFWVRADVVAPDAALDDGPLAPEILVPAEGEERPPELPAPRGTR